ncbi:hypothetical protein HD554DRAFT_2034365 [Boletus coccyginus]|nr:hypothetical protein HD554DRAFT_2034365 [Boletus coccyginus]
MFAVNTGIWTATFAGLALILWVLRRSATPKPTNRAGRIGDHGGGDIHGFGSATREHVYIMVLPWYDSICFMKVQNLVQFTNTAPVRLQVLHREMDPRAAEYGSSA